VGVINPPMIPPLLNYSAYQKFFPHYGPSPFPGGGENKQKPLAYESERRLWEFYHFSRKIVSFLPHTGPDRHPVLALQDK
jgi:hypothetical protein